MNHNQAALDVAHELRRLLEKAEAGEMLSIAYVVEIEPSRHYFGMTDGYAQRPHELLAMTSRVQYKLNQFMSVQGGEPVTDMVPL